MVAHLFEYPAQVTVAFDAAPQVPHATAVRTKLAHAGKVTPGAEHPCLPPPYQRFVQARS